MADEDDWTRPTGAGYYPAQVPVKPPMAPPPQPPANNMAAAPKADARRDVQEQFARMQPPPANAQLPPAPGFGGPPPAPPQVLQPPTMPANLSPEDQLKFQQIYGTTPQAAKALKEKFGLTGILEVVRMHDPHLNTLALGMDLTALGNMNFPDAFHSSGAEMPPSRREPDYNLCFSYYSNPTTLKKSHMGKFANEALFYMFYNMPKENMQALAAYELYSRGWKYKKAEMIWYFEQNQAGEGSQWCMFDPTSWERKTTQPQVIDSTVFATEEEVFFQVREMPA